MGKNFTKLIIFTVGVAIGSLTAYQYTKKKYEKIVQEEIKSVKAVFSRRESADGEEDAGSDDTKVNVQEKMTIKEYAEKVRERGYTNYSNIDLDIKEEETEIMDKPYIISPEEFGESDEYETISLTCYADKVLTDENDERIEDVEGMVGADALNHFGEFEDDSVFVRNDRLKCDYEILLDQRTYYDERRTE